MPSQRTGITLGILAGGHAKRLGGIDKAWLHRDGISQVLRLHDMFVSQVATALVSANRNLPRYEVYGLQTVTDRVGDAGPVAGIDAMVAGCQTEWLLTIPVDVLTVPVDLLERLAASGRGTFAQDNDGPQPLIALWEVEKTRHAVASALVSGRLAVQELQSRLDMPPTQFVDFRFGNLNTHADLDAAGITSGV